MRQARKNGAGKLASDKSQDRTEEFDREFVADSFGPAPPEVKARFERAQRKRGRPKVGSGSQAISVTIERTLLRRVDRLARDRNTTRSALISLGLRKMLHKSPTTKRG